MNLNTKNILEKHPVPKEYLLDKRFSYKMYLYLCNNCFWNDISDSKCRYEYYLHYFVISKLIELASVSKSYFTNQMRYDIYRIKIDDNGFKHLYFNSPNSNFVTIYSKTVKEILELDELTIRAFVYIQSFSSKDVIGLTYDRLLVAIGYSCNSNNNKTKLKNGINKLIELKLINRELKSNGLKTYYIYQK